MPTPLKTTETIQHSHHDWDQLMDGRQYRFDPGVDFESDNSIRTSARQAAKRRGKKALTKGEPGGAVLIQFVDPPKKKRKK
ncbi:hypothetical protein [Roseiconus lacunae]|uniref:hypothetical protein n=1 Tax=Roseiconus lacunae TaxID=2605694 RepID=UPI001E44AF79|nr:hypothetical protein [Roseiconus lacunae]MCD0459143.1 hypothetical protein [Roseiconus lacunae]